MKPSVFLVDDHAVVRQGLRALLADAGFRVVGDCADVTEALAELPRLDPDVVVVDLSLAQRSGLELVEQVQRRKLRCRPLVLTMSAQPRHVGDALRLGAWGYVLKGSPSEELVQGIDEVARGHRFFGSGVAELATRASAAAADGDPFAALSARERQVVLMVVNGASSTEIGLALHLSPKTVDSYRSRLMAKLGVADVTALVRLALRHGLIGPDP